MPGAYERRPAPAREHGASFNDDFPLVEAGVPAEVIAEVAERTPGFPTWQQEEWQVCCTNACVFEGLLTPEAFARLDDETIAGLGVPADRVAEWRAEYTGDDRGVYAFRCPACSEPRYWADAS